ncbi:MAG: tryptophanyl-tRNA synthetase [Thermoproteota archaeon]|nr:tryptophanyl-tRNA synthetase [Thermoproteota archaeon]
MVVTPWKVSGEVDYDRLVQKFGTQLLTDDLLNRIKKHAGFLHLQLRRGFFFSHRDFDWILDQYESGNPPVLYTGRGPSGKIHLGHILPWIFTKYLQDAFNTKLYFQLTDDEKFLIHPEFDMKKMSDITYDNILDIIAVGFDPRKTKIITDVKDISSLYELALKVARHVNFSTVKAVFGFEDASNIGIIFFPAIQAAPAFLESSLANRNVPCLIPAAIDQDPYWRVARDVAQKLGYYKPAQIHSKFLPGLGKGGKMSSSMPETCIFMTDTPNVAKKKIMNAFTGGQATVVEQKRLGGNPSICPVGLYNYYLFEGDDKAAGELWKNCGSGAILCGECKILLAEKIKVFLLEHQKKRVEAKETIEKYLM